ncbi:MAG: histidinol-phosphatase [Pseudomonadota bacterium]
MQDFIKLANHLADEAGKTIFPYFRSNVDVDNKEDDSPVTIADRAVEQALRKIIEENRPQDGIIGEEYGIQESKNQYDWVLDPIDGTKSFIIGRPTFGTLIALCENGIPILGIIDQPILKERWVGARDEKTTFNGKEVRTSSCKKLSEARVISTHPVMVDNWKNLDEKSGFYVWGGDCYSFGLLASGYLDIAIESHLSTYDYAALPPIIEGAGGHMCDWDGKPVTIHSDGRILALGDIALKDEILEIL